MGMGSNSKNVQVANGGTTEDEERKRDTETPLASQSLLLLLVLTNHCTAAHNPYRDALYGFTDSQGKFQHLFDHIRFIDLYIQIDVFFFSNYPTDDSASMPTKSVTYFKFNLDALYATICKVPNTDETTLLLYMLLHRNPNVKGYIMRREDIQLLVRK